MKIGKLEVANPFFLAPLAGVSDMPFRKICHEMGSGLAFTEMVSGKAIYHNNVNVAPLLAIDPDEGPVIVQLFGNDPVLLHDMIQKIDSPQMSGFDINMGCPVPKIVNNKEGSHLMTNPKLVKAIVKSIRSATNKSVSIKFRKGFDGTMVNAIEIGQIAESEGADFITVHGRTRDQFYSGKADWEIIRGVKESVKIPVIGNGDIFTAVDGLNMMEQTGCEGVLIARGAMGNPWIFQQLNALYANGKTLAPPSPEEIVQVLLRHAKDLAAFKGEFIALREMRKHTGWYIKGHKHAVEIRKHVNEIETMTDLERLVKILVS